MPSSSQKLTFVEGISTMGGAGNPSMKSGLGIHVYSCNANMEKQAFYSSDGDFLIVPQEGTLLIKTELGIMKVQPLEIAVI